MMLQDISPRKLHNEYRPNYTPQSGDYVLSFKDGELLMGLSEEKVCFPKVEELDEEARKGLAYLFSVDDEVFLLARNGAIEVEGYGYEKLKALRDKYYLPKEYVFAAFTAYQLDEWYSVKKYCGKCGSQNEDHSKERARICPVCGNVIYPRINPAVIIGVTDKETNRIILTKYRTGFGHNALVAGFTEIGETLEETVEREVMEEVGLKVTNIRYYKSQPWGIASDILAGFFCDVKGDPTIQMDESELKYAEWVKPEDIVLQPLEYSMTNEMMKLFKEKGYEGTLK